MTSFIVKNTQIDASALFKTAQEPMFNASQLFGSDISSDLLDTPFGSVLYFDGTE